MIIAVDWDVKHQTKKQKPCYNINSDLDITVMLWLPIFFYVLNFTKEL